MEAPILLTSPRSRQAVRLPTTSGRSRSRSSPPAPLQHRRTSDTRPSQPSNVLPSPFYPPTLAAQEGLKSSYAAPPLPIAYPSLPPSVPVAQPDLKDAGTPDEWVLREEKLVRLTGRWPFNCEAPLPSLFSAGFLTPTNLFYVRNHGLVPRVSLAEAHNWTLEISGLVARPLTLTLANLLDQALFNTVTLPITLVCAGNRRKEQNVVRKSLGFSWGPAGLSTALFTGVYLVDVLEMVGTRCEGVRGEEGFRKPEHVIFEGAEDLPDGKYGTSQRLRWARMKEKGMLLAWAMNGEALEPDHGYPLRLVVPGQIGGRSVKWLKKIILSDKESQHHLHFWDNKVLPTTLMPEQARSEREWWYDPRYIINDLNTNSAIAHPAHDELLILPSPPEPTYYTLAGYAYAGGGRRVNRVEITLDAGVSWILAEVSYPEDQYRTEAFSGPVWGTLDLTDRDECFCWAFWECKVDVRELEKAGSVAVRGMDESLHVQGQSMYWNPTGMMNNWWFRVAIHKTLENGLTTLRFEHPTMPGTQPGGWMERMKDLGLDVLNPIFTDSPAVEDTKILELSQQKAVVVMTKAGVDRRISVEELRAHNTEAEPWFAVNGEVYDGTPFLKAHPGGAESITIVAGEDASEDFMAIHSVDAKIKLREYHIGTLIPSTLTTALSILPTVPDATFLHKSKWKSAQLVSIEIVNHDSRLYKFQLEHPDQPLGLPTGQHVYARLRRKVVEAATGLVEGELVQRAYTPVSASDAKGHLELLIKVYHRTKDFPEGGRMTLGFEELQVGDCVEFKGPLGSFQWLGKGLAKWRGVERRAKNIGLICGGSGITPIIQVLKGVIHDVKDFETKLWLLNANKTESDILLRSSLDSLATLAGPLRFQQHFCLSNPPEDWQYSRGRIDMAMMERHLPPPGEDSLVLVCGPGPMVEEIVEPGLKALGWDVEKCLVVF